MASSQSLQLQKRLASRIEACYDIQSLRKLHAFILHHACGDNDFLGSKVLTGYAKFGFLNESRLVFDRIVNDRLTLWSAVLVGYFRSGHFGEVTRGYLRLRRRNIGLDSSGITFCLKSCAESGDLDFGRGVHGDGFKFGLSGSPFMGSSLIRFYEKCEDIYSARKVFDEITERDAIMYTSMISGYAHIGGENAIGAFTIVRDMQMQGLEPNRVTLVSLLQAAAQVKAVKEGVSVHGYAIRRGIGSADEVFETSLMDMYMKCAAPQKAVRVFGNLTVKTVVWNVLISGHVRNGYDLEALRLFSHLTAHNDFVVDLVTLASGLVGCANLKFAKEGKSIHGYIIRNGIKLDIIATTSLLHMYSKCGNLSKGRNIFDATVNRDVVLMNVMITCYLENGLSSEALKMYNELSECRMAANEATILSVVAASSSQEDTRVGKMVHGHIIRNWLPLNVEVDNQIISMYSKLGCVDYAWRVFSPMIYKDLVSWTSMMMAYVLCGFAGKVVSLFRTMLREKLDLDSVILIILLKAVSQLCCVNLAREIDSYIYRIRMERTIPLVNSLLTTYAKCGKLDTARLLFEQTSRKLSSSWNAIIAAYGMHGDCKEALMLFDKMREDKVVPDETTFTSLLSACSHSGEVDECLRVFRLMRDECNVIPNIIHYCCIIDLLSRAGRLEDAYHLLGYLPAEHSVPSMSSLLSGCKVHNNTEIGEEIGRQLLHVEPEKSSSCSLLSSLYAEGERWNEVAQVRSLLKDRGYRITTGYSMVDLST
uniref:Pentatricopeptide repeat-containing protein n=1 Tax=Kalanchoe fedtschenkoi TaxID=63787 RepID=A0A7N1A6M1_KALFE